MAMNIRQLLESKAGKAIAIGVVALGLVALILNIRSFFRDNGPDVQYTSTYICSETLKTFTHRNQIGDTVPILSPYSGKNTGIPAEACYWNRDGTIKKTPTWVLVNEFIGKHEPTFCPDCGRLVVGHNPRPEEGAKPPPTAEEYNSRVASHPAAPSRDSER